jgi:hypothetical protein
MLLHQSNPDNDVLTTHNRGVVASLYQTVLVQHQIVVSSVHGLESTSFG